MMKNETLHIVGLSGGKDSTATLLIAIDRLGKENVRAVFADTGNENPETYAYLEYLEQVLGISVVRLKPDFSEEITKKRLFIARDRRRGRDKRGDKIRWSNKAKRRALAVLQPTGNPFLDLCLLKGRFPTNRARFCTEWLKRDTFVEYVDSVIQQEGRPVVVVWQGIRRDESDKRKNAKKIERMARGYYNFRPIVDWTVEDVFRCIASHGLEPNPLYATLGRVGCAPCIYATKGDVRLLAASSPARIERVRDWEHLVGQASKKGFAAFFQGKELAGTKPGEVSNLVFWERHQIDGILHWAAKEGRFFAGDWEEDEENTESSGPRCGSEMGLCE
ncbi:phosphoadenosine phosphosulfate reductase [Acidithiobacillus ferrivorans SS3]|uniref:Phosphoadenosine phosphosulfate reductase n=1 Tax=Acidithiobacillus ferrivorans SS3 TaxID=743299 RepID=G0JLK4_9PROT|nr:phosphoadenosine phosphosulfate reductase family protein [Acidithiobacillus ferrivorans]AEM48053.1 phosphoadenosine phosphosulfate reductase [Acidithiobacillus ferrivorans SS3]